MNVSLDRYITLQVRTSSKDASGGATRTWADDATVNAQKVSLSSRTGRTAMAMRDQVDIVLRVRYNSAITTHCRFVYEGKTYDIVGAYEDDEGRRQFTILLGRFTEGQPT